MSDIAKILQAYGEGIDSQGWAEGYDEAVKSLEQLVNQEVVKALDSIGPVTEWQPKSPFNINRSTGYNDALKDYNRCIAKLRATYTQDTSK